MIFGTDVNGAQRWLGIGSITIQPSEIAKISAIGFTAFFLSKTNKENEGTMFKIMIICIGITCLLILFDNFSTAALLFLICFLMMIIGQISWKYLKYIVLPGLAILTIVIAAFTLIPDETLKEYAQGRSSTWVSRIEKHISDDIDFNDPAKYEITRKNFQTTHSKIAIANGGIIGFPGSGSSRDFLPQAYSDFIYSIIVEEMGLIGAIIVLLLYFALAIRAGMLARKCKKMFPKYLLLGSALILVIQALVNMSVAVGLIPVTGQPLPLISRGGTSTIITCAYFGIILACSNIKDEEHENVDESIANIPFN